MFTKIALTALALTVAMLAGCNRGDDAQRAAQQDAPEASGKQFPKQRFEDPRAAYNAHKAQQEAAQATGDQPAAEAESK